MTNRGGRVQRMHAAFAPPGKAHTAWEILVRLAKAVGVPMTYGHPRAVFAEMVTAVPAFAGADWGREVRPLQLRFAGSRG